MFRGSVLQAAVELVEAVLDLLAIRQKLLWVFELVHFFSRVLEIPTVLGMFGRKIGADPGG